LDVCGEKEEQSMAYIRISPGKRGNCGVCVGEEGYKTAKKLRKRINRLGGRYERIATDEFG
jgi:hypothetical protein